MTSPEFKKPVNAYKWDKAMEIEKNADILDFNSGSYLFIGKSAMEKFMRMCVTESQIAKLPFHDRLIQGACDRGEPEECAGQEHCKFDLP